MVKLQFDIIFSNLTRQFVPYSFNLNFDDFFWINIELTDKFTDRYSIQTEWIHVSFSVHHSIVIVFCGTGFFLSWTLFCSTEDYISLRFSLIVYSVNIFYNSACHLQSILEVSQFNSYDNMLVILFLHNWGY